MIHWESGEGGRSAPPKARAPVKFAGGGLAPRTPVLVRRWLIAGTRTGDPRGFEEKAGSGMIFAALVGLVFGVSDLDYIEALPRMILFQGLKTAYEMLVPKAFFTGGPSVYRSYVTELAKGGPVPDHPWIGFTTQSLFFGSIIGSITFWLSRIIF